MDRLLKNRKLVNSFIAVLMSGIGYLAADAMHTMKLDIDFAQAEAARANIETARLNAIKLDRAEFQAELKQQFDEYRTLLETHERNSENRLQRALRSR